MLEDLRADINKLIALYEAEKVKNRTLNNDLQQSRIQNEKYKKQITELERQIDNLKLKAAFCGTSDNGEEAKAKIDRMIKEIDRCMALLEA